MSKECCEESCKPGCGCGSSCGNEKECCEENTSCGKMMMDMANESWSELMKEKMKAAYEKAIGDKMSKMASVGVEACMAYWNQKMKNEASCAEFEEKLKKAMMYESLR